MRTRGDGLCFVDSHAIVIGNLIAQSKKEKTLSSLSLYSNLRCELIVFQRPVFHAGGRLSVFINFVTQRFGNLTTCKG